MYARGYGDVWGLGLKIYTPPKTHESFARAFLVKGRKVFVGPTLGFHVILGTWFRV